MNYTHRSEALMSQCRFSLISVGSHGLMSAPRPSIAQGSSASPYLACWCFGCYVNVHVLVLLYEL